MNSRLSIYERSGLLLNEALYSFADPALLELETSFDLEKQAPCEQMVLRMMIKSPWSQGFCIPKELSWTTPLLEQVHSYQKKHFIDHPFCYLTVRCGLVSTTTDDVWHVDGFSKRVPHLPEQNYLLTTDYPTEVLHQVFEIPSDFDPFKHNIHLFFQDRADVSKSRPASKNKIMVFDPYVVHRRPPSSFGKFRKMIRISFVPVEIEDDTCQQNPLLIHKLYNRVDVRSKLKKYPF